MVEGINILADVLNALPGIHTAEKCGGHDRASDPWRNGDFYITFAVEATEKAHRSLAWILWVLHKAEGIDQYVTVGVKLSVAHKKPYFLLEGWNLKAETVAEILQNARNRTRQQAA